MIDYQTILILIFCVGYSCIIFEHVFGVHKSAFALLTGVLMWLCYMHFAPGPTSEKLKALSHHLSDITEVLLFLIGAMTIVELIVVNRGFDVVRRTIAISSPRKLFWVLAGMSFWTSSVLDNLTSILVMVSLLRQTVQDKKVVTLLSAGLIFVVNVGGAWTPIGDITTTMLWIDGRVNTLPLALGIGVPSMVSCLVFVALYAKTIPVLPITLSPVEEGAAPKQARTVLALGVSGLLAVPLFKVGLGIPPYLGMMLSLSAIWLLTDLLQGKNEEKRELKIESILTRIDISCVLFFLGILLAVSCLEVSGLLNQAAVFSKEWLSDPYLFSMSLGLLSAVVDNVPLVAAVIKMFDLNPYPADHLFWLLNAFCAGVGGSLLIVGSAPGVALMTLQQIPFFWYIRKVSGIALISYVTGWGMIYLLSI